MNAMGKRVKSSASNKGKKKGQLKARPIKRAPAYSCKTEKETNTVALLQELQGKKGFLAREDMIALARKEGVPGVNVYGVATFYSQFRLKKPGKHLISICRGTACHVKDSETLLHFVEEELGIVAGESTPDGKFTLECVNCIGACAKAPAMMINGKVYGELTKEKIAKILTEYN